MHYIKMSLSVLVLWTLFWSAGYGTYSVSKHEVNLHNLRSDELPKKAEVNISGDINRQIHFSKDDINVAFLPGKSKKEFTFGIVMDHYNDTQETRVNIGSFSPFTFTSGIEQKTVVLNGGSIKTGPGDNLKSYTCDKYYMFYEKDKLGKSTMAYLTLSKAERVKSNNKYLVRYHLVGTFRFNAAYSPDPLCRECSMEAGLATAKGERHPGFNAVLCKAKQAKVTGNFDIIQDFPASAF